MSGWVDEIREEYLRQGSEEAARGAGGDFGGVDGGDEEGEADADAGEEAAKHEKGIVGGESHEDGSDEEDGAGEDDGVTATYPVGGSAGEAWAYQRVEVDDSEQDLDLLVRDFQVPFYVYGCSTHHSNICNQSSHLIL